MYLCKEYVPTMRSLRKNQVMKYNVHIPTIIDYDTTSVLPIGKGHGQTGISLGHLKKRFGLTKVI